MNRIGVLAVCPSAWRGVRQSITFDADAFSDPRGARTAIRLLRPSVVRFGGYDPAWRSILRRARAHGCAVVVTIQGTPAFHEFAASARTALAAAIEDHRRGLIDRLESPDPGVAGTLTALGIPCALNPNRLDPLPAPLAPTRSRSGLHLGILGSGHPCKNMDCQILAAALVLGEHGEGAIHVQHTAGGVLMRTVGVNYHVHPWMERSRFTGLLASMTLNLAVTFTEAFGYLPVESFLLGVPCLFTPMTTAFHEVEPSSPLWRCRVDRIDDPTAIARAIRDVLADRDAIAAAGRAFCQRHLRGARLG